MADYVYGDQQIKFSVRDSLAPGNADKVVKGIQLDAEFERLQVVSTSKLNDIDPTFTGQLNGGTVSGGTY